MADEADWARVDAYFDERLGFGDADLAAALAANAAAGLPAIDVSPAHGRMLRIFAAMVGARRVLEIGTLGGYSTICLARALPEGGRVVTLEADPRHAEVARGNIARAGLGATVEIRVGKALDTLPTLVGEPPFDLVFVDADKPSNPDYLAWAVRLSRPGTAIVVDNVVRHGRVADAADEDPSVRGSRALLDALHDHPRLLSTAVQTVGVKGWDGFVLAIVAAG